MKEQFLVFDIETIPLEWNTFSESQKEYLFRRASTQEEREQKLRELALTPMTAQVVCIGTIFIETEDFNHFEIKKIAFSKTQAEDECVLEPELLPDGETRCYLSSEKQLLENFWKILEKYPNLHLISFNGRNFDAPFLMLRSAYYKIRPSRNLMSGTKFNYGLHTDLIDELTYFSGSGYGATRRFNFDFYARFFGIESPKAQDIDGSKVNEYFKAGKILEITEYCMRDVVATWELYKLWRKYLKF